jgi:hypothetical protein
MVRRITRFGLKIHHVSSFLCKDAKLQLMSTILYLGVYLIMSLFSPSWALFFSGV